MQNYILANILLDDSEQFLKAPTLCCRATAPFRRATNEDEEAWLLSKSGTFDFTTYFNMLSVAKWKEYTHASTFYLHLELKGGACSFVQTRADSFNWYPDCLEETRIEIATSDTWKSFDFELQHTDDDVLVAFMLELDDADVLIRGSYYYSVLDEKHIRPVELAICTTTFKKEAYIEKNIELIKKHVLEANPSVSQHVQLHVVDNGRTLDVHSLSSESVHIHPNNNVGGAGGFARGMIEAMEQTPKATHVLLMDDDVLIAPESIIRSYRLLGIVNDEYAEAFVSGAMMNMDEPDMRWEDMGYVAFDGRFFPVKPAARMSSLHELVEGEAFRLSPDKPHLADTSQCYAAWWYCIIPMSQIEKNGLPLPIFVRCDDVEYSLRCKPRFITMGGICIWHLSFFMRYSAAVERYQMMRNVFIARACSDIAPLSDFPKCLYHIVQLELKKFNYTNAQLALEGFEDFLKGPSFIAQPVAESCFMEANRRAEQLIPLVELRKQAQEQGIDLSDITTIELNQDPPRSLFERLQDFVSFNGQRVDLGYVKKAQFTVVDAAGWMYPAGRIRRKDTLVAIDLQNQRGVIRKMDKKQFRDVWARYKRDMKYYESIKEELHDAYAKERARFTSVAYWKEYLGLNGSDEVQ